MSFGSIPNHVRPCRGYKMLQVAQLHQSEISTRKLHAESQLRAIMDISPVQTEVIHDMALVTNTLNYV